MVDVTSNATVYPSANDIAVTEKEGRFATEQKHSGYMDQWLDNHVIAALTLSTPGGLVVDVAAGDAIIDGRLVNINATISVTVVDATTNHIFLRLSPDTGDVTGVDLISSTSPTPPVRSVKLGRAIASGGVITSTIDDRNSNVIQADGVTSKALDILRFNSVLSVDTITGALRVQVTKTFSLGDLRGRTNPVKLLVLGSGYIVDGGISGSRNTTMRLRLNTATISKQIITTDTGGSKNGAYSMHNIFSLDPTVVNTIDLTAETTSANITTNDNTLTIIEIGD